MESSPRALNLRLPMVPTGARQRAQVGLHSIILLSGAHLFLGVVLDTSRVLSTLHAVAVLLLGLRFATSNSRDQRVLYVLAYIGTADVLWRMTKARVFWEHGKYAMVLLMLIVMLRRKVRSGFAPWAALYFVLLLPSAVLTVGYFGLDDELRQALSFNLSGPFSLAVAVVFFSGWRGPMPDLSKILMWLLMPAISIFGIALYSTLTSAGLSFNLQANAVTSGGFGPNQVAAILGLGVLASLMLAINTPDPPVRVFYLGIAGVLQLQSLLTFSRGGTFNLVLATIVLGAHYIQHRRARQIFVSILTVGLVLGTAFVLPRLNAWTSGMMTERFSSFDSTGRQSLAEADLRLFKEHPLIGVGPGLSRFRRTEAFRRLIAAHTEFTRLLAEHGTLGAAATLILFLIVYQGYRLAPTALSKGWVAGLATWSLAEMSHSAMRIVAISFLFGLAMIPFHRYRRRR